MDDRDDDRRHTASRLIKADAMKVYEAFVRPERVAAWLPPTGATAEIRAFEPWPGGAFSLVLTFSQAAGKSSANSDVVEARFVELAPGERIVYAVEFASDRPEFAGVMTMSWRLSPRPDGVLVEVTATEVPPGISRADHELGMTSSLANLAAFVETR